MNKDISDKDIKDWENFISSDEKLPNKDFKKSNHKIFKTKSIDLHGYTLEEANKTIEEYIYKSFKEKINKLIVVTGKGLHSQNEKDPYVSKDLSILKYSVPEFLKSIKLARPFKNVEILWASVREPYNYIQAKQIGCHIITIPPTTIEKIEKFGRTFDELTKETVKNFLIDSKKSRFKI